jgi:hypothetical protein
MTYTSDVEIIAEDGAVRRIRVIWAEEPHFNVLSEVREHDSSTWRALRAFDADSREELTHVSSSRFASALGGWRITIRPKITPPGGRP